MNVMIKTALACCSIALFLLVAPAEKAAAVTLSYNVEGALDLDCTQGAVSVAGGCAFRAMFDITDPVMDGGTGNVPLNIMFELLDSADTLLSSYNGPFSALTVVIQPDGVVTDNIIGTMPASNTGYDLSAGFWSWNLDGYTVPLDFVDLNGVSISLKPIPIPAALPLLASGLALLGLLGWRRKRAGTA